MAALVMDEKEGYLHFCDVDRLRHDSFEIFYRVRGLGGS